LNAITIDSGTTRTRISLWADGQCLHTTVCEVGARQTAADRHSGALQQALRDGICRLMSLGNLHFNNLAGLIASGMITSNAGLCEIPHLLAPAGLPELAAGLQCRSFPDICPLPLWFIPGVRCEENAPGQGLGDMMRGEETEAMGCLGAQARLPVIMMFPGSHNKMIRINAQSEIEHSATSMSGELLDALTHHTLLAQSVENDFPHEYLPEWIQKGCEATRSVGFPSAAFGTRLLRVLQGVSREQAANYLMGSVAAGDIDALEGCFPGAHMPIRILGQGIYAQALAGLLAAQRMDAAQLPADTATNAAGRGALKIAKARWGDQKWV